MSKSNETCFSWHWGCRVSPLHTRRMLNCCYFCYDLFVKRPSLVSARPHSYDWLALACDGDFFFIFFPPPFILFTLHLRNDERVKCYLTWPTAKHLLAIWLLALGCSMFAVRCSLFAFRFSLIKLIASRMKCGAYEKLLTYLLANIHPGQKIVLAVMQTPRLVLGDVDRLDDAGVLRLYRVLQVPQCVVIAQLHQLAPCIIPQCA